LEELFFTWLLFRWIRVKAAAFDFETTVFRAGLDMTCDPGICPGNEREAR